MPTLNGFIVAYTHDAFGFPRMSDEQILSGGRTDIKLRLGRELNMLTPVSYWQLILLPIIVLLLFRSSICFFLVLFPICCNMAWERYRIYRWPEEQKLVESKREQLIKRIKTEIKKLEKPDPEWSRLEWSRLKMLKIESQKFRRSIGDSRVN